MSIYAHENVSNSRYFQKSIEHEEKGLIIACDFDGTIFKGPENDWSDAVLEEKYLDLELIENLGNVPVYIVTGREIGQKDKIADLLKDYILLLQVICYKLTDWTEPTFRENYLLFKLESFHFIQLCHPESQIDIWDDDKSVIRAAIAAGYYTRLIE
jgi:tyrosine-protein phosphatase YwqE